MPKLPTGFRKLVRLRADGSEHIRYQARIYKTDSRGVKKRLPVYGHTIEETKEHLQKLQQRVVADFKSNHETVEQYLSAWLVNIKATRQFRTWELYEALVRNHIAPNIGSVALGKLKRVHIRRLLNQNMSEEGERTRQLAYRVLHYALSDAVEDELIQSNPVLKKDKPRYTPGEHAVLDKAEVKRVLDKAKEGDHYTLFFLALETGMRQGEIFGLRWEWVDFASRNIWVNATLTTSEQGEPVLSAPKASRKRRVDISPQLTSLLREHKKHQRPLGPWVFADINGEPLSKDKFVRTVFHPLLAAAKVKRIRFHDLRHTSATLALSNGDNVKVVSERLGHSSAKMTLDVYAKAVPTLQRASAARMGSVLFGFGAQPGAHARIQNRRTQ